MTSTINGNPGHAQAEAGVIGSVGQDDGQSPMGSPLDESHLRELADARAQLKPIRRASIGAICSAVTLLICAFFSLLIGIFDTTSLVIGLVLTVVGCVELRGALRLRTAQPGAAKLLMCNQLVLAAVLFLYAGHGMYSTLMTDPKTFGLSAETIAFTEQNPDFDMGSGIGELARIVMLGFYAGVALFAIFVQGSMAWWYARKERQLRNWRRRTPDWTVDLLQRAA
ncbi:MAG: hypothetical protein KAS72_08920 [Phycisphaerales bacterium]|nr:hypothetical protein [Phycisphaerales bacterium]